MMDDIFADMLLEQPAWIIIYMDDILIFADDDQQLEARTKKVLQRLRDQDLYLKAEKCEFRKPRIDCLGMVIEQGKLSMDPTKVEGITKWPIPKSVKEV